MSVKQIMAATGVGFLAGSMGVAARQLSQAPAPAPHCSTRGSIAAWKTFEGDQAPGFGAALLPPHYKPNTTTSGYICVPGSDCVAQSTVPPLPIQGVIEYLELDPGYGPLSLDNDLQALASLEALESSDNATDACFAQNLKDAFDGAPVFQTIAQDTNVQTNTSAAFLGNFWSNITDLNASLKQNPSLVGVFYNLITATGGHTCKAILDMYKVA